MQPSRSLSEISANGAKYNNLPLNIFSKLASASTEKETLQTIVEIVYQTLKCDRAVVYSMQSESMCKITAEAVTPGYAEILGTTIKDPCFEARYIDKYQRGRVSAITNIYEAGMSPCYVENLTKIDVKSNLVVPLTAPDNSLYGLLVTHQCVRTRQWQQTEIEFLLSVADWTMKQMFQQKATLDLEQQISSNKQTQELLNEITREIYGAATSEEVLQIAVDRGKEILNCDRVVVYGLQSGNQGEIVAEATIPALASILASVIKDPCFEYRYIDRYQQGRVRAISNIYEAGMTDCYVDNLAKIGVKANLVVPINRDNGEIYGLLVAHHCFSFKDWQDSEIENFKQIGFHAGLSLSKAKLKEQSVLVEMGLRELNNTHNKINQAQTKIQQIDKPMQNTKRVLVEIDNLNKLLAREINLINHNSSSETKKDIKLISIIARKMAMNSSKLRESLSDVNRDRNEAQDVLKQAREDYRDRDRELAPSPLDN
ncbi:GAF domain-containing protein [Waterburya agarophytonicola]|nr:GAF domain-containing protein [Waterburya agarophytonicola]